jgi:hypothetical protein
MAVSAGARRVAVVVDRPLPAWQAAALAALRAADGVEVVRVGQRDAPGPSALRRARLAVERRGYGLTGDALAPTTEIAPLPDGGGPADLVVWLAEREPDEAPDAPLLSLRHDGRPSLRDAFAAAVLDGAATVLTEAVLAEGATERVVARTWSGVRPFSAAFSASLAAWKLAALVPRALLAPTADELPPRPPNVRGLAVTREARLLVQTADRLAVVAARRVVYRRPWEVRVRRRRPDPAAGWDDAPDVRIPWRRGHVYADPFLLERGGVHHLFVEDIPPGTGRGVIAHVALDASGRAAGPPEPVLESQHHLSYPSIFEHAGEVFLIPETSAARRVELWRATGFPTQWRREAVLLEDVEAVDATVFEHDGRLWMAVGIAAPGAGTLDELHLFWARDGDPRGPWNPHPANPVVSDARCARPAGRVFAHEGRLIRPGQDGSRRYGGALTFRAIDELTPTTYREHELDRLDPDAIPGARAVHSYAVDSAFEAIDVRRRTARISHRFGVR